MYGYWCQRSLSDSWTESQNDNEGESSLATTQMNPPKRHQVEQGPNIGKIAKTPSIPGAPHLNSCQSLEPPQQQDSSTEELIIGLEQGTEVRLSLEEGVLILAPETALQLTVENTVLVIIQYIMPSVDDFTLECHAQDGDISDMKGENVPLSPAEEGEATPLYHQPLMISPVNHIAGISPFLLVTPLCIPCCLAVFPQRYPLLPTTSPVGPADSSFSLHGMELLCTSSLKPMPSSPSPGPQIYHRVHHRPPGRAWRCLFRK
uniref:Uncharacterized protein n=1 Tax=Pongo abelii TaxID=9601 RepID=A0A8I5YR88_PONAB